MGQSYTVDYELSDDDEHVHHVWDNGIEPTLTVDPGEETSAVEGLGWHSRQYGLEE